MNTQEAAALLSVAAAFDNRKPDPDAATAWAIALDGMRFEDCRDAIVAHYRSGSEWLMPGHIIAAVKRVRAKRIALAGDLCPPPGLTEAEERAWTGQARARIGNGEPVETVAPNPELTRRDLRELGMVKHIDVADGIKPLREERRAAAHRLAADNAAREQVRATKQAERERARAADRAARDERESA